LRKFSGRAAGAEGGWRLLALAVRETWDPGEAIPATVRYIRSMPSPSSTGPEVGTERSVAARGHIPRLGVE